VENINDNTCLPSSLHEYAFGSGTRERISLFANDADGFAGLSRPLRRKEAYEMLEACLSQELHAVSRHSRQKNKLAVARLWAELDDPSVLDRILSRHRHLYYAWKTNGDVDPVGVAVIDREVDRIDELIELGHSINSGEGKLSPLHLAVDDENEPMAAALIERGAAVSALDEHSRSPLSYAAMHGTSSLVARLLAAGADPMSMDEGGKTALIFAAEGGHRACAFTAPSIVRLQPSGCPRANSI
jgi:stress-induced morphogen